MSLDRIFRNARISRQQKVLDIGISAGGFAAIGTGLLSDAPSVDLADRAVAPAA